MSGERRATVLVTGAGGKTGLAVIRALERHPVVVRAFVRSAKREPSVRRCGAREVVLGEMLDRDAWSRAAAHVSSIYHLAPNVHESETEFGGEAIRAAERAGVNYFVFHSVLHPQIESMPHHWQKLRVEEKLLKSRIPFTILQPAAYMQNVFAHRKSIVEDGVFPIPYDAATQLSPVNLSDVAQAAAAVLTEDGHEGATYELAGPDRLDQQVVVNLLSTWAGREVAVREILRSEWECSARANGLSDYAIRALLCMFEHYERHGFCGNSRVLAGLLGRQPTSFSSYLKEESVAESRSVTLS